jgi:hypothetical protein
MRRDGTHLGFLLVVALLAIALLGALFVSGRFSGRPDLPKFGPVRVTVSQHHGPSIPHVPAVPRVVRSRARRNYSASRTAIPARLFGFIYVPSSRFCLPARATFSPSLAGVPTVYARAPPIVNFQSTKAPGESRSRKATGCRLLRDAGAGRYGRTPRSPSYRRVARRFSFARSSTSARSQFRLEEITRCAEY